MGGTLIVVRFVLDVASRSVAGEKLYSCGNPKHVLVAEQDMGAHAEASHNTRLYLMIPGDGELRMNKSGPYWPTGLSLNQNVEGWPTTAHDLGKNKICPEHEELMSTIALRRIGWIDQRGNVWVDEAEWRKAGGPNGSITPLLVNPGCD